MASLLQKLMESFSLGTGNSSAPLDLRGPLELRQGILENTVTRLYFTDVINHDVDNGVTVLAVHGDFGTEASMEAPVEALARLGCRVRIPLMRGHGFSPRRSIVKEDSKFGYSHTGIIIDDYALAFERTAADNPDRIILPLHFSAAVFWGANYFNGLMQNPTDGRMQK
ncbi:hypothetical protein HYX12_03415, partial [Candidatus Woesearchaeota archaeon]|nr:hypothetical protein [Candidatus Woesearchaeota archaeon]